MAVNTLERPNPLSNHQDMNHALLEISMAINGSLEPEAILEKVLRFTRELINCEDASILLWDSDAVKFERGNSTTSAGTTIINRMRPGGATHWILENGEPVIVPDIFADPFNINPLTLEGGIQAYAGFPLKDKETVIGVLYALSHTKRAFMPEEIELVQILANMAAISLKNAVMMESLRELNEFKDTLMGMAAHDLRAPLSLSVGFALMLDEAIPEPNEVQQKCLDVIHKSNTRMEKLIAGILDFGRLTSKVELSKADVDINKIAQEAWVNHEEFAAQKSQSVTLQSAPKPALVMGDRLLLLEAVGNLISNAIKYTPPAGSISIRTFVTEKNISLSVQDSGVGIQAKEMGKLFVPFSRLSSAGSEQGTGLGLNLVKTIIERHQGNVTAASTPGAGSTFTLTLPQSQT